MSYRYFGPALLALFLCGSHSMTAADYSPRQYYGGWQRNQQAGYHYRSYYYKPNPSYRGYKHHYVVWSPTSRQHYYFYNPYTKKYWGRCPVYHEGNGGYSRLEPDYQRGKLSEIKESAFPSPSDPPGIPESNDGVPLDLPPDDLPEAEHPAP